MYTLFTTLGVMLLAVVIFAGAKARAQSACLAEGYAGAMVDWKFNAYCYKRVDQTDVVVRLK